MLLDHRIKDQEQEGLHSETNTVNRLGAILSNLEDTDMTKDPAITCKDNVVRDIYLTSLMYLEPRKMCDSVNSGSCKTEYSQVPLP